jgi:hypothetical protein
MQRWIIAGALVLFLLGGGAIFGYWKIKQQTPDFQYLLVTFKPEASSEERAKEAKWMKERLLTDPILTGVVRDCNIVTKWGLPSESAAVEELRGRAIVETGFNAIEGVSTEVLRIGFNGVVAEHADLQALAERLMEDVRRLIQQKQPGVAPPPGEAAPAGGTQKF